MATLNPLLNTIQIPLGTEVPPGRVVKEVDIVSIVRVRIYIGIKKDNNVVTEQVTSAKIQVRRSDTIENLTHTILLENEIEEIAKGKGVKDLSNVQVNLSQAGIRIRGNQSASLLFEDRHSHVADAEVTYTYTIPMPTQGNVQCATYIEITNYDGTKPRHYRISNQTFLLLYSDNIDSFVSMLRHRVSADDEARLHDGQIYSTCIVKCNGNEVPSKTKIIQLFRDPFEPNTEITVTFKYTLPEPACCIIQ